jgi:asparagine synthase (glutamine-hydrolysing)
MCGIAGVIAASSKPISPFAPMLRAQAHRGPDGAGLLIRNAERPQVHYASALSSDLLSHKSDTLWCHHRLAIIDPTPQAAQPMQDASGRYWLMFNGEIYNYRELQHELKQLGVLFKTQSDTEVLLAAFCMWGDGCWSKLRGMWAAVIWDSQEDVFTFSRDRFGMKPLYYHLGNDEIIFASEIKTILAVLPQKPAIHAPAVADFVVHGYTDHLPQTFFEGIHIFPPACYAKLRRSQLGSLKPVSYWQLSRQPLDHASTIEFGQKLLSSVEEHLRSDVPLGVCLSGGLDSSSLAVLMNQQGMHAYTAVYDGYVYDESRWAQDVARHTKATWHAVHPTAEHMLRDWSALLWHQEQPFASLSIYAQWCVLRAAHDSGIKVVLSGQGADEALCGYSKYYYYHLWELLRQKRFGNLASEAIGVALHGDTRLFSPQRLMGGASSLFSRQLQFMQPHSKNADAHSLQDWQDLDIHQRTLPAILRFEDRNAMAFSVESRLPFLDHRLFEYSYQLPDHLKLAAGRNKVALRQAMQGIVPDSVLARRQKVGFEVPQAQWLVGPLAQIARDSLCGDFRFSAWMDSARVQSCLVDAIHHPKSSKHGIAMRLFILNEWARRFGLTA